MFTEHKYSLERALSQGGICQEKGFFTKEEIITKTLTRLAPALRTDKDALVDLFLEREKLMSTGINHGVAVPHSREYLQTGGEDIIYLVHLDRPIAWGSLDRRGVHTLFFLFAISNKHHLQLLARIAHLASQPNFISLLSSGQISDEVLLDYIRQWELNQSQLSD